MTELLTDTVAKTKYWHVLEDGRVRATRQGVRADELRKFLETGE